MVLKTHRYSDTSKILRLMTREHGPRSALARGVLRPRSRISGLLEPFAEGVATLYLKPNRDLHTLSDFELIRDRQNLGRDLRRYSGASVLCELVLRLAPEHSDVRLFGLLTEALDELLDVPPADVMGSAVAGIWRLTEALGFSPAMDACQRCGTAIGSEEGGFDFRAGGLTCARCTAPGSRLTAEELARFRQLAGGEPVAGALDPRHIASLIQFVRYHAAEGYRLQSLDFLSPGREL